MTIDVRITFANRAEAEILVAELRARAGAHRLASQTGILLDATAACIEQCMRYQRVVRESHMAGKSLAPALRLVQAAEKILPIPGEGKA